MDPQTIFRAVAAVTFLAAGFDLGAAFLIRALHVSTPDGDDR